MRIRTDIRIIVKDGFIFKTGKLQGANILVDTWRIENEILYFSKTFEATDIDPNTKQKKTTTKTEEAKFLIEEELLLLEVSGVRIFPIFEEEEQNNELNI